MQSSLLTAVFLPLALAVVMLGMGLGLVPEDFKRITRYPKAVAVGSICQIVVLPLIAVLITLVIPMEPVLAVGLIILAICPGGPSSNLMTYLAKGDVALSVTLTAVSSLITVFTIPIFANLALQYFMGQSAAIALPIGQTMLQIFLITLLPTAIGMGIRQQFPTTARYLERQMGRLAVGLLILIIGMIIVREADKLPGFIAQVGFAVILLNWLGMLIGFLAGTLFRLPFAQRICIGIEVGIQNATLAIAITTGLLNNADMAVPPAVYSLAMLMTGFAVIFYGQKVNGQKVNDQTVSGIPPALKNTDS